MPPPPPIRIVFVWSRLRVMAGRWIRKPNERTMPAETATEGRPLASNDDDALGLHVCVWAHVEVRYSIG